MLKKQFAISATIAAVLAFSASMASAQLKIPKLSALGGGPVPKGAETSVTAKIDKGDLVVRFICGEPEIKKLKRDEKRRDLGIWENDCVEFFIDADSDGNTYCHFMLDAAGAKGDAFCDLKKARKEIRWNPPWKGEVEIGEKSWIATMRIPLGVLNAKGRVWGMNFCRERKAGSGGNQTWAKLSGGFHKPNEFEKVDTAILGRMPAGFESLSVAAPAGRKGDSGDVWRIDVRNIGGELLKLNLTANVRKKGFSKKNPIEIPPRSKRTAIVALPGNLAHEDYAVEFEISDADGILLWWNEANSSSLKRGGSAKAPDFTIAGKPFFPIGMYLVVSQANSDGWKSISMLSEAGFNCLVDYLGEWQPEYYKQLHEACAKNNLLIIPSVRSAHGLDFIKKHADDPLVAGWYVADEPSDSPAKYIAKYKEIKKLDSKHMVAACYNHPGMIGEFEKANDCVMVDPYPRPGTHDLSLDMVSNFIDTAYELSRNEKPVVAVLQCYKDGARGRYPTWRELRAMTYLAMNHGARGVIYWAYAWSRSGSISEREIWPALKTTVRELNAMWKVYRRGTPLKISGATEKVELRAFEYERQAYVVAVNWADESESVEIKIPNSKSAMLAEVGNPKNKFKLDKGALKLSLAPFETKILTTNAAYAASFDFAKTSARIAEIKRKFRNRVESNPFSMFSGAKAHYPNEKKWDSDNHPTNPYMLIDGSRYSFWIEQKIPKNCHVDVFLKHPTKMDKIALYYQGEVALQGRSEDKWFELKKSGKLKRGAVFAVGGATIDAVRINVLADRTFLFELEKAE